MYSFTYSVAYKHSRFFLRLEQTPWYASLLARCGLPSVRRWAANKSRVVSNVPISVGHADVLAPDLVNAIYGEDDDA